MSNKSYNSPTVFFTERSYFKGAYIFIGGYIGYSILGFLYFMFVRWLFGNNPIIYKQLLIFLIISILLILLVPLLIIMGYRKYRDNPPLPPNWQKKPGTIVDNNGGYGIVVDIEGKQYHYTQPLGNLDRRLALVYMREDHKIDVMVNMNNISEYKVLIEDYIKRQEDRNIKRIQGWDLNYKFMDSHQINDNQIIIKGTLDRDASSVIVDRATTKIHTHKFNAVILYRDPQTEEIYRFKCSSLITDLLYVKYQHDNKNRDVPVEVIVDRNDFSKYIVLIDKALEENFGATRDVNFKKIQ